MEWKKPYIREPTVPHLEDELGKGGDSVLDGWGLGYDLHGAKLQGAVFFVDTVLSGRSPRRFPPSLMMPLSRLCSFILTAHPHCESRVKDRFTGARPIGGQPCLSAMGRSGVSFPAGLSQRVRNEAAVSWPASFPVVRSPQTINRSRCMPVEACRRAG